ncbi:MAG: TetR/AcrR family transcriptional regulator [SAR202 cluster bacterium]|nr:TetR/AcrR family transcriptional regulator [SAR202 cluster bacterium]
MQTIRRTESEAIRKEQILGAAQRVLREKGYDNSTISDIVKEAGVAQGTFYLYFDSKKAAVMELALKLMDEITLRLKPAMDPTLTFDQRMRLFIHVVFDVGSENVDLCRLAHLGVESPIEEVGASMPDSPMFLNIVRMMQVSIDSGEMKPIKPDFAARLLMRLTSGAPTRGVLLQRRIRCGGPGGSVLADNHSRTCQLDSIRYSGVRLLNITRATRYHIRR